MEESKQKIVYTYLRGALGNQMFVYAAARAAQIRYYGQEGRILIGWEKYKKENLKDLLKEFKLCPNVEFVPNFALPARLEAFRKLCGFTYRFCKTPMEIYNQSLRMRKIAQANGVIRCEDGYIPLPEKVPNQILMDAYFQSERYFPDMEDVLRRDFSLNHELLESSKELIQQMRQSDSVCITIRRGDYIGNPVHDVCTKAYFLSAIERMKNTHKNCRFFLSSDNVIDAVKWLGLEANEFVIEPGEATAAEKIEVFKHCKHFILANSTFSWWAQYLSNAQNKTTIAPSKWFKKKNIPWDIYQKDWSIIDV